jgi:hypothetical protein
LATAVSAAPSGLVNDTGHTQCLNVTGTAREGCTPENSGDDSPFSGQDGRYGRDAVAKYPIKVVSPSQQAGAAMAVLLHAAECQQHPDPVGGRSAGTSRDATLSQGSVTDLIWELKTNYKGFQHKDWKAVCMARFKIGLIKHIILPLGHIPSQKKKPLKSGF